MALANEENMPVFIRCGIMALVAAYLNFLSQMIANPPFCQHVSKVGLAGTSAASRQRPRFQRSADLCAGDRAEEHGRAVPSPGTRLQGQVSVSPGPRPSVDQICRPHSGPELAKKLVLFRCSSEGPAQVKPQVLILTMTSEPTTNQMVCCMSGRYLSRRSVPLLVLIGRPLGSQTS